MKSSQLWEFYRSKVQVHRATATEQQLIFGGGERRDAWSVAITKKNVILFTSTFPTT